MGLESHSSCATADRALPSHLGILLGIQVNFATSYQCADLLDYKVTN